MIVLVPVTSYVVPVHGFIGPPARSAPFSVSLSFGVPGLEPAVHVPVSRMNAYSSKNASEGVVPSCMSYPAAGITALMVPKHHHTNDVPMYMPLVVATWLGW